MKQGLVRLLYNFGKRFMGWTLHMIMCVLLCYPVSIHMSHLLSTGRPISSFLCKRQKRIYLGNGRRLRRNFWPTGYIQCLLATFPKNRFPYFWPPS